MVGLVDDFRTLAGKWDVITKDGAVRYATLVIAGVAILAVPVVGQNNVRL